VPARRAWMVKVLPQLAEVRIEQACSHSR
jgi:hypothetical protein